MDMDLNLSQIKNLPPRTQWVVAVLPSILIIALFIYLIYMPKDKQIKSLEVSVAQLDKEITAAEEKIRRLDELKAENKILMAKLERLKEQLPEEKEVSELLKQISELGLKSGLEIMLWKPEPRITEPAGLYVEIPVKVEVLTEYHNLGDFYSQISRLPRLVNISDINLKVNTGKKTAGGMINASFTARTFASVKPGDIPQTQAVKR